MFGRVAGWWVACLLLAGAVAMGVFGFKVGWPFSKREEPVPSLDPAQVIVLRTPGGMLEVATLVKNEEFRWQSSYECVWIDCGKRIGQVRLPVRYTYRIPLAETWTLRKVGNAYVLSVPPPQPLLPPGLDIEKAEFSSERAGPFPPSASANREVLLRNLGPELSRRAEKPEYSAQILKDAEATVQEFAQRWMREQMGAGAAKPAVRVEFRMGESG